ncbi:MAG: hypothetical protein ACYDHH_14690 [Solirubrobacteraceae bacterium]
MLCAVQEDWAGLRQEAEQHGMGFSALGTSYLGCDRDLFIDTLNDWGRCGKEDPPSWYTGAAWTA